ncbi:MAG: cadmium-translocating P-type ATPase [Mailhella sp.]|nr:cadmium-translocating P-type ATPase [Mailhella sp.]
MKRSYLLQGLDCPHCSALIEREVSDLPEVRSVRFTPASHILELDADEDDGSLTGKIERIVHAHEKDVSVTELPASRSCGCGHDHEDALPAHGTSCGCRPTRDDTPPLLRPLHTVRTSSASAADATDRKAPSAEAVTCPNCSALIERETAALDGVESASLSLVRQQIIITMRPETAASMLRSLADIVHSHEPDVEVTETASAGNPGTVTRTYLLKGLTCPNCSALIERETAALDGVESASLSLVRQQIIITMRPETAASMLRTLADIVHSHEPDVEVTETASASRPATENDDLEKERSADRRKTLRFASGAGLFALAMLLGWTGGIDADVRLGMLAAAYIILGIDVVGRALRNIGRGRIFDENFLMSISTIGAFGIGEYPEAVAVMLFYQIGEFFQSLAVRRSRRSIASLMDIRPDSAAVMRDGSLISVSPESVCPGESIVVRPGEKVPLDGVVTEGSSMMDTRALTGESVPRRASCGDTVLSGCIAVDGMLEIRVTRPFAESTASRVLDLVENAASRKAPAENFITSFARWYTPAVVIAAAMLAVIPPLFLGGAWKEWLERCFIFLVISCPCALVISIPLTIFGGIGAASRRGVLVKGGNYLEALNHISTIVFDKTGTLTKGTFEVVAIAPAPGYTEDGVLSLAAGAERFSTHPIAQSILRAAEGKIPQHVSEASETAGRGVRASVDGHAVIAGNEKMMLDAGITPSAHTGIGSHVHVAADGIYAGCIVIADEPKADSAAALSALRAAGVERTIMLTGDEAAIGEAVAEELGIDECHAELLPDRKVEILEELDRSKKPGSKLVFVGDGINDAPVLARADIGIAMGALGSDAAIEAADIVLMTDEPSRIAEAVRIAKATRAIVVQNIVFALGVKFSFLALGALGIAGMWAAVFGDVGVMVLAVLNAMRIQKK